MKHDLKYDDKAGSTLKGTTKNSLNNKESATGLSRRGFIKGAAIAGVTLSTSAVVAKKVVESVTYASPQDRYMQDILSGDSTLSSRKYFLTTDEDKKNLVRFFIKNYKEEA